VALAELDDQRPILEQKIEELRNAERQLAELARRVETTGKTVEGQRDALDHLRKLAPASCRRQYNHAQRQLDCDKFKKLGEMKSRRNTIAAVLKLSIGNIDERDQAIAHAKAACPEAVTVSESQPLKDKAGNPVGPIAVKRQLNEPVWQRYVSGLSAELPNLEAEIAELEAAKAEALAEVATCLDCYAR
jgi:hypothetical protein